MGEIKKHGYSERLFLGTIDPSIPKLYLAGIILGLVGRR